MKKIFLALSLLLVTASYSEAASWEGLDWNPVNDEYTTVTIENGNLVVNSTNTTTPGWARAYTDTDYFEISVDMDLGPESTIMIDAWQGISGGDQLGLNISGQILFYDDDGGAPTQVSLAMPTDDDEIHTYSFKRGVDGNVTINLDGSLLWTSDGVPFDLDISMTSVLAGAMNGTGVFTSASTVPIPPSILLLGSAFIGLLGFRKKFKKA